MNYRKLYLQIISRAKSEQVSGLRKKSKESYFEAHHILPKALFPNWRRRKTNIVLLTAREHFFCHQLLVKIYPCRETISALWFMTSSGRWKTSPRTYEKVRTLLSNSRKGHPFWGIPKGEFPEDLISRLSESRKRYCREHPNRHHYTNGEISVFTDKCPEGFWNKHLLKDREAFVKKAKESHKGLNWYTNGEVSLQARECPEGFRPGRLSVISNEKAKSISEKLKKLNRERPSTWYNNGTRNFRIRLGDNVPKGLVKGKLSNRKTKNS